MKKFLFLLALMIATTEVTFAATTPQSRKRQTRTTRTATQRASTTNSRSKASTRNQSSEIPSWINGNWKYVTTIMGQRSECRIGISGSTIVVMFNGEMHYSGPFTIEGDKLIYDRHNGYSSSIFLDRANQRLMVDKSTPFYRF